MDARFLHAMRRRQHYRDLADSGVTVEQFFAMQRQLADRGISMGWNPGRREWSIFTVNKPGNPGATTAAMWLGTGPRRSTRFPNNRTTNQRSSHALEL